MRGIKRVVVLSAELIMEAALLGCLLGTLVAGRLGLLYGVVGSALAIPVVLFLHGYYLTRVLAGLVLRLRRRWLYPAIAAALFGGHMYFALAQSQQDLTFFARATEIPFLILGACIVFTSALFGDGLLRKWNAASSNGPEHSSR